jgi:Bacterial SH3 domain
MTQPDASGLPRSRFRALRLLGWVLGTAGLAWGGAQLWHAQPTVAVSAQAAKVAAVPESVEDVATRTLRTRLREPSAAVFQEVRVFRFGPPDERAVCGRVVSRETPGGVADFVVRVIPPRGGGTGGAPLSVLEEGPGLSRATANARRRYCQDGPDRRTPPTPPPSAAPATAALTAVAATPEPGTGGNGQGSPAYGGGSATAALRRVAVAGGSAANLRSGPGGGATVIGVLPRGQVLDVFDRAPGGWLRVGVGEPWGWAHSSLLTEGP